MARFENGDLAEAFDRDVERSTGCWGWSGKRDKYGYPRAFLENDDGRFWFPAHRLSWELVHGPIPPEMCVLHRCDNPSCTNPDHLSVGTKQENVRDRVRKGRTRGGGGRKPVLNKDKVREIRRRAGAGEEPWQIAPDFGVSPAATYDVIRGKTWASVR